MKKILLSMACLMAVLALSAQSTAKSSYLTSRLTVRVI